MEAKEYWDEIRSLADAFRQAMKDGEITDDETAEEWLHQTIDSHQFVIYTYKAKCVGLHTNNPDAMLDEFGAEGLVRNESVNYEGMAYCSMMADLRMLIEGWQDEQDDETEDAA